MQCTPFGDTEECGSAASYTIQLSIGNQISITTNPLTSHNPRAREATPRGKDMIDVAGNERTNPCVFDHGAVIVGRTDVQRRIGWDQQRVMRSRSAWSIRVGPPHRGLNTHPSPRLAA